MDCKACGKRNPADNRHKLATYITRNPPPPPGKAGKKGKHAGANPAGGGGAVDEDGNPVDSSTAAGSSGGDEEDDDEDELSRRINSEAAQLPAVSVIATEDWSEDTSPEAVARRMQEMAIRPNLLGDDEEDDEEGIRKYEEFGQWLDENSKVTDEDVLSKAEEVGVAGKYKALQVIVQCIFDETIVQQIPKRTQLLMKVCFFYIFLSGLSQYEAHAFSLSSHISSVPPRSTRNTSWVASSASSASNTPKNCLLRCPSSSRSFTMPTSLTRMPFLNGARSLASGLSIRVRPSLSKMLRSRSCTGSRTRRRRSQVKKMSDGEHRVDAMEEI